MTPETVGPEPAHAQSSYRLRFDWGPVGAGVVCADADVVVLIDVLSFTTAVTVALEAGIEVLPYSSDVQSAEEYAGQHDAVLAVTRSAAQDGDISLSPVSVRSAQPPRRLVLPSPNGSAIAYQLGLQSGRCIAACLRNADAVVNWISTRHDATTVVAVIAAGERWPDRSLRPASEDLWGAGAVIAGLAGAGWTNSSPEAELALAGYELIRGAELHALLSCASGRELVDRGFGADVEIAAEVNQSVVVPVLEEHVFKPFG